MSCGNCMKQRPTRHVGHFKCSECGQIYVLAGVGPGNYWEKIEVQLLEINKLYKNWEREGWDTGSLGKRIEYLKSLILWDGDES